MVFVLVRWSTCSFTEIFCSVTLPGPGPHRLDTEPLAALLPPSLPFSAAVEEAAVAAGSMFCEAMTATGAGNTDRQTDRQAVRHKHTDTQSSDCG